MQKARVVTIALCSFLLFAVSTGVYADSALWTYKSDQEVRWHRLTDLGTLLVGTDDAILCLNPENGQPAWKREDLKKVPSTMAEEVKGTPLLLVSENSGFGQSKTKLSALDVMTGKTIWDTDKLKGFTVQIEPIYDKNLVLVVTSANRSATRDKLDIMALDMATGKIAWESEFEDKVDLHEAEASGRFIKSYDLSGHQPPLHDDKALYFSYAGMHVFDITSGKLIWKSAYDVTEGQLKRGNAQSIIDGNVIYVSAKGQLKAFDKSNGQLLWTSKDFGGAVAEMEVRGDVIYGRLGGQFYDRTKKEWELKKPLGVGALDKQTGNVLWRYDDAKDSITNMVILDGIATVLIADAKNLIGLDMNGKGDIKEKFKVKLEFKKKIGAGAIAAGASRFALGGIRGLSSKGGGSDDAPVAITMQKNDIAVVQGKQHLLAFAPQTQQIVWSVQYEAPGVAGWQKIVMGAITAAAYAASTAQAANSYAGTMENSWANQNRANLIQNYSAFSSKRYSATKASSLYTYILTDVKEGNDKGAGIVGVNMANGEAERQIMFKDKEPDYEIDEISGRIFNFKNEKELSAYSVN